MRSTFCSHAQHVAISGDGYRHSHYVCEQCTHDDPTASKANGDWLHLRQCQTCGAVLCCDSSPNQHSRKHAEAHMHQSLKAGSRETRALLSGDRAGHQVFRSAEPDEDWSYCFADNQMYEPHVKAKAPADPIASALATWTYGDEMAAYAEDKRRSTRSSAKRHVRPGKLSPTRYRPEVDFMAGVNKLLRAGVDNTDEPDVFVA